MILTLSKLYFLRILPCLYPDIILILVNYGTWVLTVLVYVHKMVNHSGIPVNPTKVQKEKLLWYRYVRTSQENLYTRTQRCHISGISS